MGSVLERPRETRGEGMHQHTGDAARSFYDLLFIHVDLAARCLKGVDEILRRDVARGSRRVRAAAQPAGRTIEPCDAVFFPRHDGIGNSHAIRVMEMKAELVDLDVAKHRIEYAPYVIGGRLPDRLSERNLPDADEDEPVADLHCAGRLHAAFV